MRLLLKQVNPDCISEFEFDVKLHRGLGMAPVPDPVHTTGVSA